MARKPTDEVVNLAAQGRMADGKAPMGLVCKSLMGTPEEFQNRSEAVCLVLSLDTDENFYGLGVGIEFPLGEDLRGAQQDRPFVLQERVGEFVSHQSIEEGRGQQRLVETDDPLPEDGSNAGVLSPCDDVDRPRVVGLCRGIGEGLSLSQGIMLGRSQRGAPP